MALTWGSQSSHALYGTTLQSAMFPSPWADLASLDMPETMPSALLWCEYIFNHSGAYREACRRVVSYFLTDVELEGQDSDIKDMWKKYLEETLDIRNVLGIVGLDLACYGNSFLSVIPTFTRHVWCPHCKSVNVPLKVAMEAPEFKFKWEGFEFRIACPKCKFHGPWKEQDLPSGDHFGFRIKRWNPHDIELAHDGWSGETQYIWKIPETDRRQIRQGHPLVLQNAPRKLIDAVKNGNNLLFEKDFICHSKEECLAGQRVQGWGLSRVLVNFRQAHYVQCLRRQNEAIAMDYITPLRLLTPAEADGATGTNPLGNMNAANFMASVHTMLRRRRRDPASWHTLAYPIKAQLVGGDAKNLAPTDMLKEGDETLLNNIGIPAEMYRCSMTLQAAPVGLRLFEASNDYVPHNYNTVLRFIIKQSAAILRWETVEARMARVTHADDANRQLSQLQLAAGGAVSQTTGLKAVGLAYKNEVRQMMEDQRFQAEEQAKLQDQMESAAQMKDIFKGPPGGQPGQPGQPQQGQPQQGQPQQGGQPGQPQQPQSILAGLPQGPNQTTTPEELMSRAQSMASQLAGMPSSQRNSELRALKNADPSLHGVVKEQLAGIDQQARTQGKEMVLAQQFGKQGSVDPLTTMWRARMLLGRLRQPTQKGTP